ncbi:MAG: hypothetical protein K2X43_14565 [Hyphomonadaceae bacterium]|nr:hypothetical protein [Hyphomonadaceae bacterium]
MADWKLASGLIVAGLLAGATLTGCSETLPLANLPDITKLPERALSKDDQQKAMNQMIEKGQAQQAEAAKQIDKGK